MNKLTLTAAGMLAICLAATLGCSVPALAADSDSVVPAAPSLKYAVRFQDLDLSRMADVRALYGRLLHAARVMCEPPRSSGMMVSAERSAEAVACIDKAVDEAITRINRPLVMQYRKSHATGGGWRAQLAQTR